jgi:hypothetical protein
MRRSERQHSAAELFAVKCLECASTGVDTVNHDSTECLSRCGFER